MCNLTSKAVKPLFCSHLIGIQDWWGKTLSRQKLLGENIALRGSSSYVEWGVKRIEFFLKNS